MEERTFKFSNRDRKRISKIYNDGGLVTEICLTMDFKRINFHEVTKNFTKCGYYKSNRRGGNCRSKRLSTKRRIKKIFRTTIEPFT